MADRIAVAGPQIGTRIALSHLRTCVPPERRDWILGTNQEGPPSLIRTAAGLGYDGGAVGFNPRCLGSPDTEYSADAASASSRARQSNGLSYYVKPTS